MMFKGLALQSLYRLSDAQLEFQIEDRRSFQRFLGLGNHQRAPDRNTFWAFRERLSQPGLAETLFKRFSSQSDQAGYISRKGQIVDASVVSAPVQRNTRDGNRRIKRGDAPQGWTDSQRRQKDTGARWTSRRGKHSYGYKTHIGVDNHRKLIRSCQAADASVHDSQRFAALPDPDNTGGEVWADSACRSQEAEGMLRRATGAGCGARPGRASRWARGSGWATGSAHG